LNKTPWFDGGEHPVRIGVYERDHCGNLEYSYWNGAGWNFAAKTVGGASLNKVFSRFQDLPWRGLLKEDV
jgi:hypothetical protein